MNAGKLRHRLTILSPSEEQGATGDVTTSWLVVAVTWASIEPLSGREIMVAQQPVGEATHRVRMRYRAGIGHDYRLQFGERIFEIVSIGNIEERNAEYEILCREAI